VDDDFERAYKIFRVLEDGQQMFVASFDDIDEARNLVASLKEIWPGDYSI
jgi:hypothetical protein